MTTVIKGSADVAIIECDIKDLEVYPAWSTTTLARVRVENGDKWTDCWLSAIVKRGRVTFVLTHEKGYPSENKGVAERSITANWLSKELPELE